VRRSLELVLAYARGPWGDALLVPEFRHKDVPLARLLSSVSGRPLVVDPLVSRFDTKVDDWGSAAPGSLQADHNRRIDRATVRFADLLLCDTPEHARYFQEQYRVPQERCAVVPVGFDDTVFRPLPEPPPAPFRVAFYGSYLTLHGIDVIVAAAAALRDDDIRFTLVGGGQTFEHARSAAARGLPIDIVPPLAPAALVARLAQAHVLLGIFGTSPKAARVVPNKVYQGLALGRPLVTADTPAIRAFFEPGVHLETVPAGDPGALAQAIRALRADPERRARLAAAGAAHVHACFVPEQVASRFLEAGGRVLGWGVHPA
jgi:glycosyltransferase involved in cell wall biosynthesis